MRGQKTAGVHTPSQPYSDWENPVFAPRCNNRSSARACVQKPVFVGQRACSRFRSARKRAAYRDRDCGGFVFCKQALVQFDSPEAPVAPQNGTSQGFHFEAGGRGENPLEERHRPHVRHFLEEYNDVISLKSSARPDSPKCNVHSRCENASCARSQSFKP